MRILHVSLTEEQFQALELSGTEISLDELQRLLAARNALRSLGRLQAIAVAGKLDQLSEVEIEAEIQAVRREKKDRT